RAAHAKAWMIAFTHDVDDAPSPWGTSIEAFERFVVAARDAGVALVPVGTVLEQARHAAH
ncbi:MAG TPA: hypothetical protein VG943_03880, partial [Caulobacterales bacterium]|nr:hypothetical protein [Caulobacterales bacterium]